MLDGYKQFNKFTYLGLLVLHVILGWRGCAAMQWVSSRMAIL